VRYGVSIRRALSASSLSVSNGFQVAEKCASCATRWILTLNCPSIFERDRQVALLVGT
jgi:hypothetical protein